MLQGIREETLLKRPWQRQKHEILTPTRTGILLLCGEK